MTAVLPDPAFLAYIDHHHLADKLLALHWQRIGVGVAGAVLAVGYNMYRAPGTDGLASWMSVALGGLFVAGGIVTCLVTWRRLAQHLRHPGEAAREQALAVADYVNGCGNHLLLLSALGHGLIVAATVFKLRLGLTLAGEGALLFLLPTAALVCHGLARRPNDRRLIALHHRATG